MSETGGTTCHLPFTSKSSLAAGLHLRAALGGGPAHLFLVDTGSVGILVPRNKLGADYQDYDPCQDTALGYVSSGNTYRGQWVAVLVILGIPADWDGSGDYPFAQIEVFAVDDPADFDGGVFGIGFAVGGLADGGPPRNPLLHVTWQGEAVSPGYIVGSQGIDAGLTALNTEGFTFVDLPQDNSGNDWLQPVGQLGLPDGFTVDLPVLVDTGIPEMILWLDVDARPPALANETPLPAGIAVSISLPPLDPAAKPALTYAFTTGDASQPMAPFQVEWRDGHGINTGRNILACADYLYDAAAGRIGFRVPPA